MTIAVALWLVVSGASPVEVAIFRAPESKDLIAAISAQLSDLEVELAILRETGPWDATDAGQLRQVRALLHGKKTRVAIWFDSTSRVHVADVWSGRHVEREIPSDSGEREATALMIRSAVAAFVETSVTEPDPVRTVESPSLEPHRFRVGVAWHLTKWGDGVPWANGPMLSAAWAFREPFSVWASVRVELPLGLKTDELRLELQRNEAALGVEYLLRFWRIDLRPRVALGVRWLRVRSVSLVEDLDAAGQQGDVGVALQGALSVSVWVIGPLSVALDGWAGVPLRSARYVVGDPDVVVFQPWAVEGGASLGAFLSF